MLEWRGFSPDAPKEGMGKLRYTRDQMEEIIFIQLENLLATGEQIQLLRQQNELLSRVNMELREEIVQYKKGNKMVPYKTKQ